MDFLEYGMQNENSGSLFRRMAAKGVLAMEKKRADLHESRLNRKEISFPDGPEENAALLKKIRDQIDDLSED